MFILLTTAHTMSQDLLNKHPAVPGIRTEQLTAPFLLSITFSRTTVLTLPDKSQFFREEEPPPPTEFSHNKPLRYQVFMISSLPFLSGYILGRLFISVDAF